MSNRKGPEPEPTNLGSFEEEQGRGFDTAPQSVDEALARALRHGKAAAAEVLAAVRALLNAISLATRGCATDEDPLLGPVAQFLEDLEAQLATDRGAPPAVLSALADALDAEIARWEERAQNDSEARAVLRAFLGVRELLWEFGVRSIRPNEPGEMETKARKPKRPKKPRKSAKKSPRVQRVHVEG